MAAFRRLSAGPSSGCACIAVLLSVVLLAGGNLGNCAERSNEGGTNARAADYELSIAPENATMAVNASTPIKSATYHFQITNTGDTSLPPCDLVLSPWDFPPEDWSYNFIPSMPSNIEVGKTNTVLLVIYPAADAEAKRYTFAVKGASGVSSNSISVNLDVLQYGGVLVKSPPQQVADPGQTLEFVFEFTNTGNGKDRVLITSIDSTSSALTVYLKDGNDLTDEVGYHQSTNKTVVVVLHSDVLTTEGSAGYQLVLTACSNFTPTLADNNWTLIHVNHLFNISLSLSLQQLSLLPGEFGDIGVTVQNLGNGWDDITLNLSAGFDADGWELSLDKTKFNLTDQASDTTKLRISSPPDALFGIRTIIVFARSSGPANSPIERNVTLEITISQVRGLFAPRLEFTATGPVRKGDTVWFSFNFTNTGNLEELVDLAFFDVPLNWTVGIDCPSEIHMPAGCLKQIDLTVQVASNRAEASNGTYRIKLQVANPDRSAMLNFSFEIIIPHYYNWELTAEGSTTARLMPGINNIANFTLVFTSIGDNGDYIGLAQSGNGSAWGRLETSGFPLPVDGIRKLNLTVEVPGDAEVGRRYGLKVTAASHNNMDLTEWLDFTITVIRVDLEVVESSLTIEPKEAEVGTPVRVSAIVRNLGSVEARFVEVAFFGPWGNLIEKKILDSLAPQNGSAVVDTNWSLWEGENEITVKVDPNSTIVEMDKGNNEESGIAIGYQSDLVIDRPLAFLKGGHPRSDVFKDSKFIVQLTVINSGAYSRNLTGVIVRLTDWYTGEVQNATIPSLKARESATLNFTWTAHRAGEHTFTAKVNPDGVIKEKTLENNEVMGTMRVSVRLTGDPGPIWLYCPFALAVIIIILTVWMIKRKWS